MRIIRAFMCVCLAASVVVPVATPVAASTSELCPDVTDATAGVVDLPADISGYTLVCGTDGNNAVSGTDGSDLIVTGAGNDIIRAGDGNDLVYAGAGDDTVYGHGGNDLIYAGAGDDTGIGDHYPSDYDLAGVPYPTPATSSDTILGGIGSDNFGGGPGHDFIDVGSSMDNSGALPVNTEFASGGAGNDVLIGTGPTWTTNFVGGPGDDILYPYPLRVLTNNVSGGDGNDVAILVNFSLRPFGDYANLDDSTSVGFGPCSFTIPTEPGEVGEVECELPWPPQLSGLGRFVDITLTVDENGRIIFGGQLLDGLATLSLGTWRELLTSPPTVDVCLCDPLYTPPDQPLTNTPYDISA